jgi:hypothetical protein
MSKKQVIEMINNLDKHYSQTCRSSIQKEEKEHTDKGLNPQHVSPQTGLQCMKGR